jgi:hypothetical protein
VSYWSAKADLDFMRVFHADLEAMWKKVDDHATWQPSSFRYLGPRPSVRDDLDYQQVRSRIAKGTTRAERIARRLKTGHSLSNVLWDSGPYKVPRQSVTDAVNVTIGAAEDEVRAELRHVRNPLWWLSQVIDVVLRLPLIVLSKMGADTEKLQKEVWPKMITAAFYALLTWLGLR